MSKRDPKLLIGDILDSADKILEYTKGLNFADFTKDSKTVDAVIAILKSSAKQQTGYQRTSKTPTLT